MSLSNEIYCDILCRYTLINVSVPSIFVQFSGQIELVLKGRTLGPSRFSFPINGRLSPHHRELGGSQRSVLSLNHLAVERRDDRCSARQRPRSWAITH